MTPLETLLTRGVDTIYPTKAALEAVLESGKKLTLYQGFDPTGTQLHIGHMVGFRKLRQWQDLGHHVIFLIGDGTGLAGDPSGKMKARGRFMSRDELRENAKAYLMQAGKIVRFDGENPVEIRYNGDWLTKLQLQEILDLAGNFTIQQMIERDMYQVRLKANEPINLREFLYPLLQGYDSVAMNVDLELGGSDQMFNMLVGRTLVKTMLNKEKFVMTTPLLTDSKGVKIGKTEGNVIGLTDEPSDFFGKIMSLGDDAIIPCFTLLTDISLEKIAEMKTAIEKKLENPIVLKKQLAFELTKMLHSDELAQKAQSDFETRFQKGRVEAVDLPTVSLGNIPLEGNTIEYIVSLGLAKSNSDARRLIEQHAIKVNDQVVSNPKEAVHVRVGDIFQAGRKAVKIIA